jgi:hypothetical protein
MVPLNSVFWALVFLFALVGALRGWAKEVMATASVLLALFVQQVIGQYILGPNNPYLPMLLTVSPEVTAPAAYSKTQFWVSSSLLIMLTFFGYAGPTIASRLSGRMAREKLQDLLLGFFLGLLNGYLILSTLWFFLHKSGYVVGGVTAPQEGTVAWVFANKYLFPLWLTPPMLYVAIALSFVFVIIVFL